AFGLPDQTLRRSEAMGQALLEAERRLRETQSLLQMAAQLGRLGAWSYEAGHERVMWSAEACAIHEVAPGYAPTPEESIAFFAPEYRECAAARVSSCLAEGTPFDLEAEIITARGRRVWVRTL